MERSRVHLFIYGDVINVGFRSWTKRQADSLGLKGWVRNLPDCVEIVFEGEKNQTAEMVKLCRKGPLTGWVERVEGKWEEYKGEFEGFEIVYE